MHVSLFRCSIAKYLYISYEECFIESHLNKVLLFRMCNAVQNMEHEEELCVQCFQHLHHPIVFNNGQCWALPQVHSSGNHPIRILCNDIELNSKWIVRRSDMYEVQKGSVGCQHLAVTILWRVLSNEGLCSLMFMLFGFFFTQFLSNVEMSRCSQSNLSN